MDLITGILSLALLAVAVGYLLKQASRRARFVSLIDKLPGPPTYPVIGNVLDICVPRNQLMNVFQRRTKNYSPIFRTWAGPFGQIHLTRPEHVEIILNSTKHIDKSLAYTFLQPWLGTGLLTGTGAKWHLHRKMITPTFHFKILDIFVDVFVEKSQILVEKLQKKVDSGVFDIYPFITLCALDIICETAMGTHLDAQSNNKSDYVTAIYDISELTLKRSLRPWVHPDVIWNLTDMGKRYAHCLNVLHGFTNKVIKERKISRIQQHNGMNGTAGEEDDSLIGKKKRLAFLDLLLDASHSGIKLTDEEIREEVDTFMFEGHDTTTAGISWALFLLGSHSEYQDKVHIELEEMFGDSSRPATMRDLNEMKYLERVIKETLRLFPSVPFIGRRLKEDTRFGEYLLPSGSLINLQLFDVHRCPDQFPDPEKFNPDNFLPDKVQGRHPYAYVPFSAGPRNCIGQKFALLEEKAVLSSILRRYRVQSQERFEDLTLMSELILRPESGIKVKLFDRKYN